MDRKKSPALTSPGKVGLLVALLLVVTGLGVSYFITGTFGLQWNWIDLGGASPTQWKFHLGSFLEEMVPLIALVALLAFASYVLVAGAVRRYQGSVSSGAEYRELLRSFKTLEDFEDERRMDELKQHPELREFVMGFKNRFAARERQLEEREKRQGGAGSARGSSSGERSNVNFSAESAVLLNAIVDSKNGFAEALTLTIPELKQIERALRERLAPRMTSDDPAAKRELESLKSSVDATLSAVRNASAAARRDAGSCVTGVQEIEAQLASLKQAIDALAVPATAANGVAAAAKRVDAVAESLAQLGEEAKRVAIAAALSASGGGDGDSIKVADEVRAIATRFNGVAQQWKEASPAIRSAIETIASSTVGAEKRRAVAGKALEAVVTKTRLWGERVVALAEAVNGLDRAAGGTAKPVKAAAPVVPAAPAAPEAEEWGNLNASLEDIGNETETADPRQAAHTFAEPANADEDFVPQRAANVFDDQGEDAPFTDIPGFEKDRRLFADESGRPARHADHETDPRFVVEREAGGEWDLARGTQAAETEAAAGKPQPAPRATQSAPPAPAPAAPSAEDDGFLTGPGAKGGSAAKAAKPAPPAPKENKPSRRIKIDDIAPAVAATAAGPDSDAVDLYALGAVDWTAAHA